MSTLEFTRPRICHVPRFEESRGGDVIELMSSCGIELDGQQQFVLENALGRRGDRWAAFEVGLCEPRQNGKNVIVAGRELAGLFLWGEKLVVHTSHEFRTSLEHFYYLQALIEEAGLQDQLKPRGGIMTGHGVEGFVTKDGCRMHFRTRTKKGGRGFSGDFLGLDEAMIISEAMLGALMPTLRARPDPQVWYTGSAVDQEIHEYGVPFARIRSRGLEGRDDDMAYFEWSVDLDDPEELSHEQAADETLWEQSNPALDDRISRAHMRKELASLDLRTFAVELLGVGDWPRIDGTRLSLIRPEEWDQLLDPDSVLQEPIVLYYDVSPERKCSIAAAGLNQDNNWHVEIVAQYPDTKRLPKRLQELVEEHEPIEVGCDGYGPAASMVGKIVQDTGIQINTLTSAEHAQACGQLADVVMQQTLRHLGDRAMANAIRGAATRPLGDGVAWSRKSSAVDISPLVAATLALSRARALIDPDDEGPVIY